jgi:hypothetical protein
MVAMSPFTMCIVLVSALLKPGLVLVAALLAGRFLWRRRA